MEYNKNELTKTDLDFQEFRDLKWKEKGLTVLQASMLFEFINTSTANHDIVGLLSHTG